MEGVRRKLLKGAAWLTLTRILMNVLGLVSTVVLARILTPADFGIVAIATTILAIANSISDLSLASALVQREDLDEVHFHSVWTMSFLRALAVFVFILCAAYPISLLYKEPRLFPVLIATGFVAGLPGLGSPKMVMLTRQLVFWQDFAVQTTARVLVFIGSVTCAVLFKNYWALIIGNLIGPLSGLTLSYLIAPYVPRISFAKFRELFTFSFWLSLGETVNTLNWKFDQLVLGYLVGKSALGIYTVADNIAVLPVREATAPLAKTLFPAFSRIASDPLRLRRAYTRAQTLVCAVALPAGFGLALVADPLARLALGPKWLDAIPIIQILSATFAFQTLSSSLQPLAMASGQTKVLFWRDLRYFAIRIPFIIVGYLAGGLLGVVIGRAAASFIGTIWNMSLVAKLSGIPVGRQFLDNARALASVILMVAGGVLLLAFLSRVEPGLHPVAEIASVIVVGGSIYVAAMLGTWFVAGRPDGPERELLKLARAIVTSRRYIDSPSTGR